MKLIYRQGEVDGIFWTSTGSVNLICTLQNTANLGSDNFHDQATPSNMTLSKKVTPFMKSKESAEKPGHLYHGTNYNKHPKILMRILDKLAVMFLVDFPINSAGLQTLN